MEVVIQDSTNHEFYGGEGQWLSTRRGALVFVNAKKAEAVAKKDKLDGVQLVVALDSDRGNFSVPLLPK